MYYPITSKVPKRSAPRRPTRVAVVGTSHVKYLFEAFPSESHLTPIVHSWSGARIVDLIREIDALPKAVDIIVLDVGTNDLMDTEPEMALHFTRFLLHFIRAARPQTQEVFVSLVHLRSVNRRLRTPNWVQVNRFNARAKEFNELLTQEVIAGGGFTLMDHGLHRHPPTAVLAADGVHFSRRGLRIVAGNLRKWVLSRYLTPSQPH